MLQTNIQAPDDRLLVHQIKLEELFNKNQLIPRIKKEFLNSKDPDFQKYLRFKKIPVPFGMDLLTQMVLHKRCNLPTMVGILRHHFGTLQETADMILKACEADLLDWSPSLHILIVRFGISDDVQEELDKYQFPLPMVIEPNKVTNNTELGYIHSKGSILLKKNHHEDDVCLDHINRANKVKLCLDMDTAMMIKNEWRNLDKQKPNETKADFEKRKKAFDKYDRSAKDVMELITHYGNEFYMTHRYDKRGRVYAQGYHINYQGTSWNKAVVQFADKELIE